MASARLPGMLAGLRGGGALEREPPVHIETEEEDEDDVVPSPEPDDSDEDGTPSTPRGRPRGADGDEAIGRAFDELLAELGRTPTNGEVAARVEWPVSGSRQTKVERVRLGLARLGRPRNRRRGGIWVK